MRHNVRGRKLNRSPSHRRMMFRNLVTDLFRHERVRTTTAKAKEARSLAERLITYAKAGDLNSRRQAARRLTDPQVLKKLFEELGPRYKDRPGGYTRILKLSQPRHGDNADMAILELVGAEEKKPRRRRRAEKAAAEALAAEEKPAAEAAPAEEAAAEESAAEETASADAGDAPASEDKDA